MQGAASYIWLSIPLVAFVALVAIISGGGRYNHDDDIGGFWP